VLDGSTVVRLLDALEASGLIERREETTDRRAKVITITSGGRSIIDQVEIASREVRDTALLGLGEADLESAARALALIQTNLEATQERAGDEPFTRAPRQRG
jgi:MarR family transcriptional regulator for hemolysin